MDILSAARTGRATPLPPDERRAAILVAVRPVLLERGVAVTSRELAEAAGVAEGTLFRVFADKATLVREAILTAIDPAGSVPELAAIDRSLPLRDRLVAVLAQGLARVDDSMRWMSLLHEIGRLDPARPPAEHHESAVRLWSRRQKAGNEAVTATIAWLLEPDQDRFRLPLEEVIELLTTVLLGTSVRTIDAARGGIEIAPPDPARLVDLVLHGVLADGSPRC
ncbi:TetR/AcrR family transcriptional regulator [Cellulomonas fengjieae]|uniref:TetR/AcrR family transcriptional regulator n=1 Tax=Cellulomonas fengjieae TaxID=2819978 RepID=A0ABS3SJF7_9CELL|nr:TetR/AcrR family transcriptional regulator [Cellulomonas fengjieae]MBO3085885.1 TetR/AcrR family transcriptional regulator [Cellulomonas fengjieae]MBO3102994.1 TetR/AcrR family transcriptional regulator [Cellulomonas fengjieae]QVI67420.1 TetR/AcrR family transcriptional regulator [Cellulomonas fengjieae]